MVCSGWLIRGRGLVLAVLVAFGLEVPAARAQQLSPSSPLGQALAISPASARGVYFTDWVRLKQYEGIPTLTSRGPLPVRARFLEAVIRDQAVASFFGAAYALRQASLWGWDATDLLWEERVEAVAGPPAYALRLRPDFDLSLVERRFRARGFTMRSYRGVAVYSHPLDLAADWAGSTDLALYNAAILPDRHTLVLSGGLLSVHAIIDTYRGVAPSLGASAASRAVATDLGVVASAVLLPGAVACRTFDPLTSLSRGAVPATRQALLHRLRLDHLRLHPYQLFGLGYRVEGKRPLGIITLHYADARDAAEDLAARSRIAATGISPRQDEPYHQLFTFLSAAAAGDDVILRLGPAHPPGLIDMVGMGDMAFAACGS